MVKKVSYKATGRKFLVDNQKNIWLSCDSGVDMITFLNENYSYFSMNHHDKIRGLFVDSRQRVWIADKSKRIEVYDREHRYIGNLNEAGDLVQDRQVILVLIFIAFSKMKLIVYGWGVERTGFMWLLPKLKNSVFFISNMIRKIREVSVRMLFMLLAKM